MSAHFEIEMKFIIKYPDVEMLKSIPGCEYTEIEQIYLSNATASERIRKRGKDGEFVYYHTIKTHVTDIRRTEKEHVISKDEYELLKKRAKPGFNAIYKTRYCIPYMGHVLEIDVFPFWKKQAFLEIELDSEEEAFNIPEFLEIISDVSTDKSYTNHSLAKIIPQEIV